MKHIYDWMQEPTTSETDRLVKEWFEHFTRPAIQKDYKWLSARRLYCTYKGKKFRCIGASRLGDIWLTSDFSKENGYEHRVDVDDCSNWEYEVR